MKNHVLFLTAAIISGSLALSACGTTSSASSVASEVSGIASEARSLAAEAESVAKKAGAAIGSAASEAGSAASSVAAQASSVAGSAASEAVSAAESIKTDLEKKTIEGTIGEIRDRQFVISSQDTDYLLTFSTPPSGLENVKEGETVIVTYSGELSEVDAFTGEVYSIEKK